jgi:hypothetical protein
MAKHWVRLTNQAGEPHAWLNMAAVAAVHPDGRGGLRIEMIGEQGQDPSPRPIIARKADVAALLAYLEKMTRQMSRAQQRPDATAALSAATGKQPPVARLAKARRASAAAQL